MKRYTTIENIINATKPTKDYLKIACEIYPDFLETKYIQYKIRAKYAARKKWMIEGKMPEVVRQVFMAPDVDQFIHKMLNNKKEG